jgi:YkoY family integral membrane protein
VDHFLPLGLVIPSDIDLGKSLLLLPVLVALEAVLSADNAIALAAIARGLGDEQRQRQALNIGLVAAFVLRVLLIVTASWVTQFWQFELAGAAYLLWLSIQYFWPKTEAQPDESADHNRFESLWQAIPLIAVTDLAFSLDSVTTAIAVSKETWLVVTGGAIGVVMLRFMAGLFIRWLKEFERLEDAGYVAVALVGLRLLLRVVAPNLVPPEVVMISLIIVTFAWGFSRRSLESTD